MLLTKLTSFITYPLLYFKEKGLSLDYKEIVIDQAKAFFEKEVNNLRKTLAIKMLVNVEKSLDNFLKSKNENLDIKERSYICALKQFVRQLIRFLQTQDAKDFPEMLENLTEEEFLAGIRELAKEKQISDQVYLLEKPYDFAYKFKRQRKTKQK